MANPQKVLGFLDLAGSRDPSLAFVMAGSQVDRRDRAPLSGRTRLNQPPGGLMLWVALPDRVCSEALFNAALEQGVRIAPGVIFSNTDRFDAFIRIGCACPIGRPAQRLAVWAARCWRISDR
ncbi:hypothetical protein WK81_11835 [Burkholderia ubonensis]|nr:DUF6691 family protein [Burkholderia ubonensis]KVV44530.1 hypothetical protein WK81_11835 [Burkholderia ubonensis]